MWNFFLSVEEIGHCVSELIQDRVLANISNDSPLHPFLVVNSRFVAIVPQPLQQRVRALASLFCAIVKLHKVFQVIQVFLN